MTVTTVCECGAPSLLCDFTLFLKHFKDYESYWSMLTVNPSGEGREENIKQFYVQTYFLQFGQPNNSLYHIYTVSCLFDSK